MKISDSEWNLLALLHLALGDVKDVTLTKEPDWKAIYHLAESHAVIGLLAEGVNVVNTFISSGRPRGGNSAVDPEQHGLYDYAGFCQLGKQLFEDSVEIVSRNKKMNELLAWVVSLLRENGIECILQKGQGVARLYPNPMMRMSGDIDLLFTKEDYEKAKSLLIPLATDVEKEIHDGTHLEILFGTYSVELHASEFNTLDEATRQQYNKLLDYLFSPEGRKQWRSYECEGVKVNLAPLDFDVFYLFLHTVKHYYTSGIGLKQVLDFVIAKQKAGSKVNNEQLQAWAAAFNLMDEWKAFSNLSLFDDSLLMRIILRQGNMGAMINSADDPNYLKRIFQIARADYLSALRYYPFSRKKIVKKYCENVMRSWTYFFNHRVLHDKAILNK